jgi:hypothetical protein
MTLRPAWKKLLSTCLKTYRQYPRTKTGQWGSHSCTGWWCDHVQSVYLCQKSQLGQGADGNDEVKWP